MQFPENYLVIRKIYNRSTSRRSRLTIEPPSSRQEYSYQDLLSEANENFFHREYNIALENYLALRNKILNQSHPEMPDLPGGALVFDIDSAKIDFNRVAELSRRHYEQADDKLKLSLKDIPLIPPSEFPVNPVMRKFQRLGLNTTDGPVGRVEILREEARKLVTSNQLDKAFEYYKDGNRIAEKTGNTILAAEMVAEWAGVQATFAVKGRARGRILKTAQKQFNTAERLFHRAGDFQAAQAMKVNQANIAVELKDQESAKEILASVNSDASIKTRDGSILNLSRGLNRLKVPPITKSTQRSENLALVPAISSSHNYLLKQNEDWSTVADLIVSHDKSSRAANKSVGLFYGGKNIEINIAKDQYLQVLKTSVYEARLSLTKLDELNFYEEVKTNFVAYIPHLFFYVLPVAIGDTYLELGRYNAAMKEYERAKKYTFLNHGVEISYLWLKMAKLNLRWGDQLFRRERSALAKKKYEQIILWKNDTLQVPTSSKLYKDAVMVPMRTIAGEVIKDINGLPFNPYNPKVGAIIIQAYQQLIKISNKLNFLGLSDSHVPIFRFKYLQSVANFMADNAVQSERTFINFRVSAEQQKLEMIQLENSIEVNEAALKVEQKKMEDAQLEVQAAGQSSQYAQLRAQNATAALNDWQTIGWELATINAALSWASNAANDQDIRYTGVHYNGESHDFDTDVEDFYDSVGEWREWHNYKLQKRRLQRQQAEMQSEIAITQTRQQQAVVRRQIQALSIKVAEKRLEGAKNMLDYAQDRMFDEDLWFQLANEMRDLARQYLDIAVYAAYIMERAYDLEFDRNLNRIRFNYGLGGPEGLLGGDYLKLDIASFTLDYLQNASKKNPVRHVISLRTEYPSSFATFTKEGLLPFRTHLEIFDRRYPGTFRRKLKKIEVFVEGLIPPDGLSGRLQHQGISSEWREHGASWKKHTRVVPPEQMIISSYQLRRDVAVFQPSQEQLGLFENLGPEGNWFFELPRSSNNLDFEAITDVKVAFYFDADHSDLLESFVKSNLPANDGKIVILSGRFHFPESYYKLNTDRLIDFKIGHHRFAYNHKNPVLDGIVVRLFDKNNIPISGESLTITRSSDNSTVIATTDVNGEIRSDLVSMAPFTAWKGDTPIDSYKVELNASLDVNLVGDIQFAYDYDFSYRSDGSLPV